MTLQLAVGYTTTAVTVFLVPVWETALSWSWVFSLLSPPTLLAICLLYRLYNHPSGYRELIARITDGAPGSNLTSDRSWPFWGVLWSS